MSSPVILKNQIVGELLMSGHALERWCERKPPDTELADSLWRAVPYGGQKHGSLLLRDDNIVFAVSKHKVVITVLTIGMAVGNMQMRGTVMGVETVKPGVMETVAVKLQPAIAGFPKSVKKKKKPQQAKKIELEGNFASGLFDKTDEQLVEMLPELVGEAKRAVGMMLALRYKMQKQTLHANAMELQRASAMRIIGDQLQGEVLMEFYRNLDVDRNWLAAAMVEKLGEE